MNQKNGLKIIQNVLILLISTVFLTGCAGLKQWFSYNSVFDGANKTALEQFNRNVRPVFGDADAQYRLARHFQKQGRHKIAVEEFIKVLKIDPEYHRAYNGLGVSYDRLRAFDLAAYAYAQALALQPDLDYVYNNMGYSKMLQGDPAQAAPAFKKAVVLNRKNRLYQNNLALALSRIDPEPVAGNNFSLPAPVLFPVETKSFPGDIAVKSVKQPEEKKNFYAVQIGVAYNLKKAVKIMKTARVKGYPNPYINKVERGDRTYYRIRFGKFLSQSKARALATGILDKYGKPCYSVMESFPMNALYSNRFDLVKFRIYQG